MSPTTLALKPIFHCTYSLVFPPLGLTTLATRSHHALRAEGQDFGIPAVMIILWKSTKTTMGILGVLPGHTEVECFGFLFFVVLAQILQSSGYE